MSKIYRWIFLLESPDSGTVIGEGWLSEAKAWRFQHRLGHRCALPPATHQRMPRHPSSSAYPAKPTGKISRFVSSPPDKRNATRTSPSSRDGVRPAFTTLLCKVVNAGLTPDGPLTN